MATTTITKGKVDLGIYSESPLLDRVQKTLNKVLVFFLQFLFIRDIIFAVVLAFLFTKQLRLHSHSVLIDILFIVISVIMYFLVGALFAKSLPKLNHLIYGRPIFGKVGGIPRKLFFTSLKCADAIKFEFQPGDIERVKEFGKADRVMTEELLKSNYKKFYSSSAEKTGPEFENAWKNIWNDQILKIKTFNSKGDEIVFDNMMAEENLSLRVESNKLSLVNLLISSTFVFFLIIMLIIIWMHVNGYITLLAVFQIGLIVSLILSSIVFAYHSHQNAEIPMADLNNIPAEIIKPFEETFKKIGTEPFRPSKVIIKQEYLPTIRNFFAQHLFWFGLLNSVILILLLAVSFLIGLIFQSANVSASLSWYANISLGLIIIPIWFLFGFYIMFLAIQHFRLLIAPVIVGILSVVLPFLLNYIFSGELDMTKFNAAFLAAGTAIVTGVVTVITTKIKSNIEGKSS